MKKFVKTLVSFMMVASLAACSSSSDSSSTSSTSSSESETSTSTGGTIKIGGSGPTTGEAAQYGTAVMYGAQVAVNEINEAAGDDGLKLELNFLDDQADSEQAATAYAQLLDWGMQVSMLCTTTGSSLAVADSYNEAGIFAMTPSGSAEDIIANKDYVYRMCFADPEQGTAAAEYISEHSLATKVAVFYQSDSDYSKGIYDTFVQEAANNGLEIVSEYSFTSDNDTDFSTGVSSALSAGAELIFLPLYYENDTKIITEASKQGFDGVYFGVDGFDGALEQEGVETSLFEGVYYLTPFAYTSPDEATQDFVSKFTALSGGTNPNQFAADAYDVVYAIYGAMVEAGVTADMSAQEIGSVLVDKFTSGYSYSGLTGSAMTWSDGAVVKAPLAFQVVDGQLTAAD